MSQIRTLLEIVQQKFSGYQNLTSCILFTRVVTQVVGVGLAVNPACDAHKVSHKTRDAALEDNIIAEHDILVVSLRVVRLGHS